MFLLRYLLVTLFVFETSYASDFGEDLTEKQERWIIRAKKVAPTWGLSEEDYLEKANTFLEKYESKSYGPKKIYDLILLSGVQKEMDLSKMFSFISK